ncbi:MAG: metallophosphoesterase, partial [Clostridia bacterium]|nr:metallophosphoesterase [Clostridia bacterium]
HAVKKAGGVDVVLTHCPPKGFGDAEDYAHRGFEAFLPMLDKWKPKALVHGHVHIAYGIPRELSYNGTRIINASGRYVLEMEPESAE